MQFILTTRAAIALDHIPPNERKRAGKFFAALSEAERLYDLGDKVHKLHRPDGEDLYVGRIGARFRAILRRRESILEILEIVDHDRLQRTYRIQGEMR